MQWRWSIPLTAVLAFTLIPPLHAQAPGAPLETEATLPVEALHQVQSSDNLHLLAAYYYGDARQWVRIFETNRGAIRNVNIISPGQILRIVLSPGWTPQENYADWKRQVREGVPLVDISPSGAPLESPNLPQRDGVVVDGSAEKAAVQGLYGGDSPQDVFRRAKAAVEQGDPRMVFRLLPPDTLAVMGFTVVQGAKLGIDMKAAMEGGDKVQAQKELDSVLKKHGVKDLPKDAPPFDLNDEEAVLAAAREMFEGVDVIALMDDMQALMRRFGFGGGGWKFTEIPDVDAELTNIEIQGDRATGTVGDEPVTFVKVNGRWYVEADGKN